MFDKRRNMRGALYGKLRKKNSEDIPRSRAGKVLFNLKRGGKGRFPKFAIAPSKGFITLPFSTEIKNVTYPVITPYAYINIKLDEKENTLVYNVVEPTLNEDEAHILKKLKEGLVQIIDISFADVRNPEKTLEFLETSVQHLLDEYGFDINEKEYVKIMYYIYRDFVGLNKIEALMNDPFIEDVGCDGLRTSVYAVHSKFGSLRTNIIYNDDQELREFVIKLAERCGRYISYSDPLLDGTLKEGSRVQASLAQDVTTRGPTFSIRKFKDTPFSPGDMMKLKTASPDVFAYLWFVVENGANILITGGVSTGKTSILNTISLFIPTEAKIVSIEDTRELNMPHDNWIPGVARVGFTGTGVGEVTMFELLKESFRQNPDYLIVGEIRGKEAYVMFQGMASGHPTISTMHAGSLDDVMNRLSSKPISLSPGLLDSLDMVIIMVHAREKGKSARRIKEIVEIESVMPNGETKSAKTFVWDPIEDNYTFKGPSWLLEKISREKGIPMDKIAKELEKRKKFMQWMADNNISNIKEVANYINMYRRNPGDLDAIAKRLDDKSYTQ